MPRFSSVTALAALSALVNASVWGLSWYPLKWLEAHGIASLWATTLVFGACALTVLAASPASARALWTHRRALGWMVFAAGMTNACFNTALATGDVVRSVLLFYLMPMWVVGLARWLLAEPITAAALARTALALLGAMLVLGDGHLRLPVPDSWSDALAIAAGFFFGLNNVLLRKHAATPQEARALGMFVGAVIIAPMVIAGMALAGKPLSLAPQPIAWLAIGLFTVAVLVGNLALQYGAAHLPANVLSVLMLTEILVATTSAWLAGAAVISQGVLLGGACIVCASVLAIFSGRNAAA